MSSGRIVRISWFPSCLPGKFGWCLKVPNVFWRGGAETSTYSVSENRAGVIAQGVLRALISLLTEFLRV